MAPNDRSFLYHHPCSLLLLCLVPLVQAKGGSYGGGGGRGGGGSYSGSYTIGAFGHSMRIHSRGGNCDEGECNSFGEIAFLAIVGQLLIFGMFGLCIGCLKLNWRRKINRAEKQVLEDSANNYESRSIGSILPETVTFLASYVDSSHEGGFEEIQSSGTLVFSSPNSNNTNMRPITGNGTDKDGVFSIIVGSLAPSGKCYWVEEEPTYKRQSLVQGCFVPCQHEGHLVFQGHWESTNGARGQFLSFELTPRVQVQGRMNDRKTTEVPQFSHQDTAPEHECAPPRNDIRHTPDASTTMSPFELV